MEPAEVSGINDDPCHQRQTGGQRLGREAIPLGELGGLAIQRASHVEPDAQGQWLADLSPIGGPTLGPFATRSEALAAEEAWLVENRLA
jgi:hypothetical protein